MNALGIHSRPIRKLVAEVAKTSEVQPVFGTPASSATGRRMVADFSDGHSQPSAADLVARIPMRLSQAGAALLEPAMTASDYFHALLAAGREPDARKLLAHALPKRRALWWGCLCAWDGLRGKATAAELAALECVAGFVRRPSEELRRAAQDARRPLKASSPAGTLAAAAFFSAGSISVPGANTPLPPPAHLAGQLAGVAVYLSAAVREPARYKLHQRHYLELGQQIAQGRHLWPDEPQGGERGDSLQHRLRLDEGEGLVGAPHFLRRDEPGKVSTPLVCGCAASSAFAADGHSHNNGHIIPVGHKYD